MRDRKAGLVFFITGQLVEYEANRSTHCGSTGRIKGSQLVKPKAHSRSTAKAKPTAHSGWTGWAKGGQLAKSKAYTGSTGQVQGLYRVNWPSQGLYWVNWSSPRLIPGQLFTTYTGSTGQAQGSSRVLRVNWSRKKADRPFLPLLLSAQVFPTNLPSCPE